MNPIGEKLTAFFKEKSVTQDDIAVRIGVSQSYVSALLSGKKAFGKKQAQRFSDLWGISPSWLLTGEGEMMNSTNELQTQESIPNRRVKLLPLLPFSAVAGYMSGGNDIDAFRSEEAVSVPDFSERGADCTIRVDGDSMYPRYSNGEILAIRIIKDPTFFQWGKVYVLSTNQGCVVKILLPDPNDPERIVCRSENSERYPDYTISMSDVFGVAIVVGHAGVE